MNQWIVADVATNPLTKAPYAYSLWPAEIKKAETVQAKEWTAKFGAANMVEYVKKNNMIGIVPNVNVVLDPEPTDIQLTRNQCGNVLKDTSWKMIFAKTDAELNKLWSDMKVQLAGLGWDKLVQYDLQTNKAIVDARAAAQRNAK
jgi:multiple sugar transport system substrate-binding protein/putative aldouronate transport system substrate-binding protein